MLCPLGSAAYAAREKALDSEVEASSIRKVDPGVFAAALHDASLICCFSVHDVMENGSSAGMTAARCPQEAIKAAPFDDPEPSQPHSLVHAPATYCPQDVVRR